MGVDREPIDVPELRAIIDDIINDNRRAGAVIYWLRGFLRKQASVLQPVSLNDVVREVIDLAHSEIVTRSVTVTSTLAPGTSSVLGDRVQLQQVVLNLLLNACDAMRETPLSQRRLVLTTAVEAHVRWSMRQLHETPEGTARMREGVLQLVGAVSALKTGRVTLHAAAAGNAIAAFPPELAPRRRQRPAARLC